MSGKSKRPKQSFTNGNYVLTDKEVDAIKAELSHYQLEWNAHFNKGDYDYCANQYTEDGLVFARPVGTYRGREAIRGFWKKVIEDGVTDFKQWDTVTNVCSDRRTLVSARWEMNKFGGTIFCEEWCKMDDGSWKILSDYFEIAFYK